MISKDDLIRRMKERENGNQNPHNLTQKQLDELEVTKAQVAEYINKYINNIDFSRHTQTTEVERQAKRLYEFSHILGNRKSRNEY